MSRILFEYTLIDRRHRAFVAGRHDVLLTFADCFLSPRLLQAYLYLASGLVFVVWGVAGLVFEFSRRNDWAFADATISIVVPVPAGDHFGWHSLYTFQTEDGQNASGWIVADDRGAFDAGEVVLVRYLRTDLAENALFREGIQKEDAYWVPVGIGALWIWVISKAFAQSFLEYRTLRELSAHGCAVPGEITAVRFSRWDIGVQYTFTAPDGQRWTVREPIFFAHIVGDPKPGTAVAVWHMRDGVSRLL